MREQKKHIDAFAFFISLGGGASQENCRRVSEEFQITERTFWNWHKKLNWKERVDEIVKLATQEIRDDAAKSIADQKQEWLVDLSKDRDKIRGYKEILDMGFGFLGDRMNDGALVAKDVPEVAQLVTAYTKLEDAEEKRIKTALLLMGEADSHAELSGSSVVFNFGGKITEEDL